MLKISFNRLNLLLVVFCLETLNVFAQDSIDDAIQKYNSGSIPYISIEQLKADLVNNEKLILLDTRSKEEYEVSHLKDAQWIGYKEFEELKVKNIDKNSKIVVYCSVGVRSEKIGEKLKSLGFENIKNLYGGVFEWVNNGYTIYVNQEPTENIHTYNKRWGQYIKRGNKIN
jgi:rhodanese-related sulfurtransferase